MRTVKFLSMLALVALVGLTVAACATPVAEEPEAITEVEQPVVEEPVVEPTAEPVVELMPDDILAVLEADGRFFTLLELIAKAGLVETLQAEGPYTLFAPSDEAFAALPEGTLDELTPEDVATILLGHVVGKNVMAADAVAMADQELETVGGGMLLVTVDGENVTIGKAIVVQPDVMAGNGTIHVIDAVILPEEEGATE